MELHTIVNNDDELYDVYWQILASVYLPIKIWRVSHRSPTAMQRIMARHRAHILSRGSKAGMLIVDMSCNSDIIPDFATMQLS